MSTIILSFFAGTLSVLSPCVLPVLPVVVASALQRHAHGLLALAAGLVASSTALGLFFASFGFVVGVDRDVARAASAVVMVAVGVTLLVPPFQDVVARLLAPVARATGALVGKPGGTLVGQFAVGILLGAVWTPCTGPTLAAAVTLAARSESVARAGVVMVAFAIGTVAPLLIVAYGSRHRRVVPARGLGTIARLGKPLMGVALLFIGALTITGTDKFVERWLVDHMPQRLLALTTRL